MAASRLLTAALAAATLLATAPAARATCMSAPVGEVVLTPKVDALAGGGAVVATHAFVAPEARAKGRLRLRVKGKLVAATPRALAPGLVVYELPAGAARGELVVGKKVVGTIRAIKGERVELAAPVAKAIQILTSTPSYDDRRGQEERTTVVLDQPAPAGALALIMYDAQGTPLTFARVAPGTTGDVVIYAAYRCEIHPPGHGGSYAGAKVTLAWVDAAGQVGARSAPITLTGVPRKD